MPSTRKHAAQDLETFFPPLSVPWLLDLPADLSLNLFWPDAADTGLWNTDARGCAAASTAGWITTAVCAVGCEDTAAVCSC